MCLTTVKEMDGYNVIKQTRPSSWKKCINCSLNINTLNKKNDSLHGYIKKAVTDVGTLKYQFI